MVFKSRVHTDSDVQQTGPLISPAVLPKLTDNQLKQLQMAKKYCLDVSTKFVSDTN